MQTFYDLERTQQLIEEKRKEVDSEIIICSICSSHWWEEIEINKFQLNHNLALGQAVPPKAGTVGYKFLKCIRCGNLLEPRIVYDARDMAFGDYAHCLDTIEGKYDRRPKEDQPLSGTIKSEKI